MSLHIYLTMEVGKPSTKGSGIFIRRNGKTEEITREEWDEKFPGREPVVLNRQEEDNTVYSDNITHNLGEMAGEAGIYEYLWRPDEIGISLAQDLIVPLTIGLGKLLKDPERFKAYNPPNRWGDYEGLVEFVESYLEACKDNPSAIISVSR